MFILANSADPDEVPLYTVFHLGLHCLPNYCLPIPRMKKEMTTMLNLERYVKITIQLSIDCSSLVLEIFKLRI